jgi:hypothetical protein
MLLAYLTRFFFTFCFLTLHINAQASTSSLDPAPYLLQENNPLYPILKNIFLNSHVLDSERTLEKAGFTLRKPQPLSYVYVIPHPLVEGYLFKLYLNSEKRQNGAYSHQEWLIRRCMGAEKIRNLIKKYKMQFFTVPDKWIYEVDTDPLTPLNKRRFALIAQKKNILPKLESALAWKTKVTKKHLEELFILMKNGCGSTMLSVNVPYTKEGTFSFIDTEYPDRQFDLERMSHFFSKEMQIYWKYLIKKSSS